jgi:hypothetical protein
MKSAPCRSAVPDGQLRTLTLFPDRGQLDSGPYGGCNRHRRVRGCQSRRFHHESGEEYARCAKGPTANRPGEAGSIHIALPLVLEPQPASPRSFGRQRPANRRACRCKMATNLFARTYPSYSARSASLNSPSVDLAASSSIRACNSSEGRSFRISSSLSGKTI